MSTIYMVVACLAFTGICSLAVDWGHVQLVKTQLQGVADATARGYIEWYQLYGASYVTSNGPSLYSSSYNPVDANSGVNPTITVTWGSWDSTTKTFTAGGSANTAVRVVAARNSANNNPVTIFWGKLFGMRSANISVTSIALSVSSQSSNVTIDATANPYLAGMPTSTINIWGDDWSSAAPYEMTSIPVVPGSIITLTNVTGSTNILPGYVSSSGANGLTSIPVHHGQNYNYTIDSPNSENGIADAVMYESTFMGLFLDDNRPDSTAAPATVDWTSGGLMDQASYTNLAIKQPFAIGNGKTSGGVTKQFKVPANATRLYLSIWDGVAWYNNTGSINATITTSATVSLVK